MVRREFAASCAHVRKEERSNINRPRADRRKIIANLIHSKQKKRSNRGLRHTSIKLETRINREINKNSSWLFEKDP